MSDLERFQSLNNRGFPTRAAAVGMRILETAPDDTMIWLQVAPTIVLAEDDQGYLEFCTRMVQKFARTVDVTTAERTCKACLLMPNVIELDQLPHALLAKSLDEGTAPSDIASWLWGSRGLVAKMPNHHDVQMAKILLQEAQTRID